MLIGFLKFLRMLNRICWH